MENTKTPLVMFTYNRPDHTRTMLHSIWKCERLADCKPIIYCDGPKIPAHEPGVASTRQVVKDWAPRLNAEVIERPSNYGLAHSIVMGVTEQCQKYSKVIVVEDDLVVSPDFLVYMLQALERYQDCSEVYQISGFMFPIKHSLTPDAFFLPLTTTWGWATWERAWRVFNWDITTAKERLADPKVSKRFDLDGNYPYTRMLYDRLEGRNDSWGILWWFAVFNINGLVLHPRQSLVWNGGFDNTGVHSGAPSDTMQSPRNSFDRPQLGSPICFPNEIIIDITAFDRLKYYLSKRSNKRNRVIRKLFRLIRPLNSTKNGR